MPKRLPRVNVTVTPEQHALLLELASLQGGSAAAFLRQMLDQVTPLLRATVPALRSATQEVNSAQHGLNQILSAARDAGLDTQAYLFDDPSPGPPAPSASEGGRTRRRPSDHG